MSASKRGAEGASVDDSVTVSAKRQKKGVTVTRLFSPD